MVSIVVRATYDDPSAEFSAAVQADVNVTVFDVLGRHVKRLYSDRVGAQVLTLQWDGTNENFERVPAGVYFIKALAADVEGVTKVVIVR
jgi:flagellar hook assembly protein FlgD